MLIHVHGGNMPQAVGLNSNLFLLPGFALVAAPVLHERSIIVRENRLNAKTIFLIL